MPNSPDFQNKSAQELLAFHPDRRDAEWERAFLKGFAQLPISVLVADPQEGPDHWPYLLVSSEAIPGQLEASAIDDSVRSVSEWLSQKGIGLVLNPQKTSPDFVLTYGMVWNFCERGEFITEVPAAKAGDFVIEPGQRLWTGVPSEAYLPSYVRSVLKQFFADQGVYAAKVLLVSFGSQGSETAPDANSYDLCFSIESLKSPPAHEHANIAEAISWFLPAHYSVSLVSEKTVPGFVAL